MHLPQKPREITLLEKLAENDFVLSMSSGYFGFFAHCGFAKAVLSEGLKPKLFTGSSAGSIMAACLASGLSISEIEKEFLGLSKSNYWDPGVGMGLLKGELFEKSLSQFLSAKADEIQTPVHIACLILKNAAPKFSRAAIYRRLCGLRARSPCFFIR
jgi:NTE family protein